MKTLDEVIVALEVCTSGYCSHPKHGDCPYLDERNDCDTRQRKLDALHYLKEFQGLSKMWNDKLDKEQANPPLTWDELRTMEGKPIWIEYNIKRKDRTLLAWCLVLIVLDEYMSVQTNAVAFRVNKSEIGTKWQAYRKERANENFG